MAQSNYDAMLDQEVTIRGVARNARMGAVVLTPDRTPVYVVGLEEWDDDLDGESIQATGTLRRRSLAPDPIVDAEGNISHGIAGTNLVLEGATWSLDPS